MIKVVKFGRNMWYDEAYLIDGVAYMLHSSNFIRFQAAKRIYDSKGNYREGVREIHPERVTKLAGYDIDNATYITLL